MTDKSHGSKPKVTALIVKLAQKPRKYNTHRTLDDQQDIQRDTNKNVAGTKTIGCAACT